MIYLDVGTPHVDNWKIVLATRVVLYVADNTIASTKHLVFFINRRLDMPLCVRQL